MKGNLELAGFGNLCSSLEEQDRLFLLKSHLQEIQTGIVEEVLTVRGIHQCFHLEIAKAKNRRGRALPESVGRETQYNEAAFY